MNCRFIVRSYQLPVSSLQFWKLIPHTSYLIALCFLAACQPAAPSATVPAENVLEVKQLATVYISPTPNQAEAAATRQAFTPTPRMAAASATPTATAYVGVFLGEVQSDEGPAFSLAQQPPTPNLIATQLPNCSTAPDAVFGADWNADAEVPRLLGCPIQIAAQFRGVTQVFERGVMYWRGDTGEIWAIATGNASKGRYWYVAQSAEAMNEDVQPPAGLRAPVRGFGGVWRNTPDVRDALGFARTDEQELAMQSQRFDGGLLFLDSSAGLVFALIVDGSAYGPFPV